MDFLRWLIDRVLTFLTLLWTKRAKPYVRVSIALISAGGLILSAPPIIYLLRALDFVVLEDRGNPWWTDPLVGLTPLILGVAIFVAFYLADPDRRKATPPPESLTIVIPRGWTFEQTTIAIGEMVGKPIELEQFSDGERRTILRNQEVRAETPVKLLEALRVLAPGNTLPEYEVSSGVSTIIVRRR